MPDPAGFLERVVIVKSTNKMLSPSIDLRDKANLPDDWAKISGKKGERIVFIRTLVKGREAAEREGGRAIERVGTGQYL